MLDDGSQDHQVQREDSEINNTEKAVEIVNEKCMILPRNLFL